MLRRAAPAVSPPGLGAGPREATPPQEAPGRPADRPRGAGAWVRGTLRDGVASLRALPGRVAHDRVLQILTLLLAVGLVLRVWLMLVWSPAITGYSDSGIYFQDSVDSLWTDPIRTVGYSMVLRVLHGIWANLLLVTIIQHALGLASAVIIFATVRRCGGPRWLGLIPAAMIALGGDQLFLEHAALSDAVFIFVLMITLYCAVRAMQGGIGWVIAAGFFVGLNVWERGDALFMAGVIPLWLLFRYGRPTLRTLGHAALALVVAFAMVGVYVGWRHAASNMPGTLTSNNAWNLYGRVATWADCRNFTPPAGTGLLCDPTPASERGYPSSEDYIYNTGSPAWTNFGPPYLISKYPHAMELLQKWSIAAIEGEPLEYLRAVGLDLVRIVEPNSRSYGDESPDEMIAFMLGGTDRHSGKNEFVEYWQGRLYPTEGAPHRGDIAPLKTWEELTRVEGVWMAVLLALLVIGPWVVPRGRARAGFCLFALTSIATLVFPILVKAYDYRFMIPAFAPLMAAGSLAGWGLAIKVREARRARQVPRAA